ncbi:PPC domain-containing DNA-binding protein [Haloplanus halobius]|uniref:PPC domain-containing DNA-binding protein n=1 Tax=Haloplanus halobius TaxID=2934938 RepID=UPI00200BC50F|nr:PPC domain-containing DNA-binding protein [Haloplanus sp. XH21]
MDARELTVSAEYLVAIEDGDDWRAAIEDFADAEDITAAWFTGTGTVRDADVWHYDPAAEEHRSVRFDEPLSVAACVGAVSAPDDGDAAARPHAVLTRPSGQAVGGYLNAATAVGGRVALRAFEEPFDWILDDRTPR